MLSWNNVQHGLPRAGAALQVRQLSDGDSPLSAQRASAGKCFGFLLPKLFSTGLVTSLQREIAVKEQKIQQLRQDVEKIKKANREKDNQLAVVSAKVSTPVTCSVSDGLIHGLVWNNKIQRVSLLSGKDWSSYFSSCVMGTDVTAGS